MNVGGNSKEQLKSIIERIENIESEIAERQEDRKAIYAEAKGNGFEVAALRVIIKRRKADADKLAELESIIETYLHALGDLASTPLGAAAIERATKNERLPELA